MIILPDIHGRMFWKEAIRQKKAGEVVLFLGDYMEPYTSFEDITSDESYENFTEIIDYKKNNADECILLLGNHDFACIDDDMITCRHDYNNSKRNRDIFIDNESFFKIAHSTKIGDITYLFTHAGVHSEWFHDITEYDPDDISEYLNRMYEEDYDRLKRYLKRISSYRGGWTYNYGSCIWADVREFIKKNPDMPEFDNTYQIFGHTLLSNEHISRKWFSCVDVRNAFRLHEENGQLEQITFEQYLN